MAIYYFIGGCEKETGYKGELINYFLNDLTDKDKISFIVTSPDDYHKNDKYFHTNIEWFNNLNIKFKNYTVIDNRMNPDEMIEHIKNSQVIYLMGGDPFTQIEFIKKNGLDSYLKEFNGVILGISAGAINMGLKSLCTKDEDYDTTSIYDGIGLVDLTIEPHFDINKKEILERELYPLSNEIDIYGVPNDSAIKIEDSNITYIGNIYKIKNKIIEQINNL